MNGNLAREIPVRRRILEIYNKSEEDFETLRNYNDYLEEVEDIIFNLTEGVDVAATEARVRQYRDENLEQITQAAARRAQERQAALQEQFLASAVVTAPSEAVQATPSAASQDDAAARPAGMYVPNGPGAQNPFMPMAPIMAMQPMPIEGAHPTMNGIEDPVVKEQRAKRAGGYSDDMAIQRAIEEAFCSVFL